MSCKIQQCSHCKAVRYRMGSGWSNWYEISPAIKNELRHIGTEEVNLGALCETCSKLETIRETDGSLLHETE